MHKILVIRLYFPLDALHVSACISPSSGATFISCTSHLVYAGICRYQMRCTAYKSNNSVYLYCIGLVEKKPLNLKENYLLAVSIRKRGTRWGSWLRHRATSRKVAGSMVSLEFFIDIIHPAAL